MKKLAIILNCMWNVSRKMCDYCKFLRSTSITKTNTSNLNSLVELHIYVDKCVVH